MILRPRAALGAAVVPLVLATLLSGCGAPPDGGRASDAASSFLTAVADGDGEAACALLSPRAQANLAEEATTTCAEAVLEPDVVSELAEPGAALDEQPQAYGRQAQVRIGGDVMFLVLDRRDWLVSAAGCTPRTDQPYDCTIEGS